MKKVLVFQHVAWEILGSFHPLLKDAGFRIRYINFGRDPHAKPKVKEYDGLIVLGGPMGVYEHDKHPHLHTEVHCIRDAIEQGKPVLGICLGAQLIASALGAEVKPNGTKEIGWYDLSLTEAGKKDPVLGHLGDREKIFQWHGDTFGIPKGAEWLAKSDACTNQAFRYGEKVYGFQFHLEVDETMMQRWLAEPSNLKEIEELGGPGHLQQIKTDTPKYTARQTELSNAAFGKYIALFGTKKKRTVLGSIR